jgi:hypothetical protein
MTLNQSRSLMLVFSNTVYVLGAALADVVEWARGQLERFAAASRALYDAIRPTLALKKCFAIVLIREASKQFTKGHLSRCHVHTNNIGIF